MFEDAFPATRNAIRRLEQIRAAQASRPAANHGAGHNPVQPDHTLSRSGPEKVSDLVVRLNGLPATARVEIVIFTGASEATQGAAR